MPTAKSNRPIIIEHNTQTDEVIEREMTDSEYERFLADKAETEANVAALAAKESARQAVLDKLGLSADEVAALLG